MRTIQTFESHTPRVFVIHEHDEWTAPLLRELSNLEIPYESWHIDRDHIDLSKPPPQGIFYNRMSASSHTRGHRYAVELTATMLVWLQSYGRKVLNNARAMHLEVRKAEQYLALGSFNIKTPRSIIVNGRLEAIKAAEKFDGIPFIFKPNRGGKGTDVKLFDDMESFRRFSANYNFDVLDGIYLLQQYIAPPTQSITRLEFVNGRFLYAVEVDTSGGFELCPADTCAINDAFCPAIDANRPRFRIKEKYYNEEIPRYEAFLAENGMAVAALELVQDNDGNQFVYDVNINTNYNTEAEKALLPEERGMRKIAEFLEGELEKFKMKSSFQVAG